MTSTSRLKADTSQTIKPGYWVALTVAPDTAPLRVYVGQVQAIDTHGIRITLMDWLAGMPCDFDFYASWETVQSALVATPDHDLREFAHRAAQWQDRMQAQAERGSEV